MAICILHNARIYPHTTKHITASAIVIDRGIIRALGNDTDILSEYESHGKLYNLENRVIIPGLCDAHIHLKQYALSLQRLNCETTTRAECINRVSEKARNIHAGDWILGHGWNQNDWTEGFGNANDLDSIAPHNPVFLSAKSLHTAWVNTKALQVAGINQNTPNPQDGLIQRDDQGKPTGILFEKAINLVSDIIPEPPIEEIAQAIIKAQQILLSHGITSVHDFDKSDCFSALQILHRRNNLYLRVMKSISMDDLPFAIELGMRSGFGDDFLRIISVKLFADGALSQLTAAMHKPFNDQPDNLGILLLDSRELHKVGMIATKNGFSLAVHAIGDRANHEVLDGFAQLRTYESEKGHPLLRHRIEHAQLIDPIDLPRLSELKIIASMQPLHAISDMYGADIHWGERASNAYVWQKLKNSGAMLAFGSDAPVESPNPFWGIHAAVTRLHPNSKPDQNGWYPDQCLSFSDALFAYTRGAYYAANLEDRLGTLIPGFLADLLVLDINPFTCEPDHIRDIHPYATMVNGKWVHGPYND